jgi:hypothetical protein
MSESASAGSATAVARSTAVVATVVDSAEYWKSRYQLARQACRVLANRLSDHEAQETRQALRRNGHCPFCYDLIQSCTGCCTKCGHPIVECDCDRCEKCHKLLDKQGRCIPCNRCTVCSGLSKNCVCCAACGGENEANCECTGSAGNRDHKKCKLEATRVPDSKKN